MNRMCRIWFAKFVKWTFQSPEKCNIQKSPYEHENWWFPWTVFEKSVVTIFTHLDSHKNPLKLNLLN